MIIRMLVSSGFAVLATLAHAQTPGPSAAAAMPQVPPSTCVKPEVPSKLASDFQIKTFNRESKSYGTCVKQYLADMQNLSNTAIAAANKALEEYNAYNEALKATQEQQKE